MPALLARTWRGTTRADDADAYLDYLHATGLAEYAAVTGNRGVLALRRATDDGTVEWLLVSLWESADAVRAFTGTAAGDATALTQAVFYPEDDAFLVARDARATHFEIAYAALPPTAADRSAPHPERASSPPAPPAPESAPARWRLVAAFAAIYGFWGATFLATRVAVHSVPPLLTIVVRCAGGAVLLGAWAAWRGAWQRPTTAQWRTAFAAGALLFLGCHAVTAWAEQRVTSGRAALYLTAIPLWTVALTAVRDRRWPALRVLAGLALGVAGVAVLTAGTPATGGPGTGGPGPVAGDTVRDLALVAAALCWAAGSLVGRDGARPTSAVQGTAMQLAGGAVVVLIGGLLTGEVRTWSPAMLTGPALGALAFLVTCGTVLGFAAYTWLLRVRDPATVGTYAFVNPVVAVVLAWVAGDERASAGTALALALVLGAVLLTWDRRPTPTRRST